jgi:hypothetical protein
MRDRVSRRRVCSCSKFNLVHMLAAGTRIAFNIVPVDTAEAVQRWIKP